MTLRYFFRVQDNPDSPDYRKPLSVYRFEVTSITVVTERWDAIQAKWIDNPGMIDFVGIGGATDYREVDVAEAERFLKRVSQNGGRPVATQYNITDEGRRQAELDKAQQALFDQDRNEGRNIVVRATDSLVAALRTFADVFTGRGGAGSGHYGHAGREGEVGGSQPGEGGNRAEFGRGKSGTYIAVPREAAKVGMTSAEMNAADISQPSGGTVRGTVMAIDDPRIPEMIYHMTTNISGIESSKEISAGGAGGLEGDPKDQMVSMTIDEPTAEGLVRDTRLVATIAKEFGPTQPEYGNDRTAWGRSLVDRITQLDSAAKDANWEWEGLHPLQYERHGLNDIVGAYMISREMQGGINNPLFFGEIKDMARLDPKEVGYVRIPRENLDTGALLTDFDLDNPYGLKEIRLYGDVPLKGAEFVERGGPGSGHRGHAGRPGEVGGSQPGEGGAASEGKTYRGGTIIPLTLAEQGRIQQAINYFGKDYDLALAVSASGEAPEGKFPILDPDTGEVVWLTGGRDPVLSHVEDQFRDSEVEHLTIINPDGTLVLRIDGNAETIPVTNEQIAQISSEIEQGRETVMTHNHPAWGPLDSQNSFSTVDVKSGMGFGFSEIRAVVENGTYYMRFKDQISFGKQALIMATADLALGTEFEIRGLNDFRGVDFHSISPEEQRAYIDGTHEAWTTLSEMFPDVIEYGFEARKEND